MRNWMAARSVARPMIPPRASTSRTTVPFATPPIAGLHDIWPMVSRALVTRAVRAPRRAEATAASVPACPAPTTSTSNSASNAEDPADMPDKIASSNRPYGAYGGRERAAWITSRPSQLLAERSMALLVTQGVPTLFFRRASYERAGLTRAALDARLGLTDAEFRVEGTLVAIGPVYDVDAQG